MLHLIPRPLHVAALRTAHFLRLHWWRMTGRSVIGCRVLVLDDAGRVLLVRHSYGTRHWMMPGGGVRRGEDVARAAAREVLEEVGLKIGSLIEIEFADEDLQGVRNHVHVLAGWTDQSAVPDGREVIEAQFFALEDLPPNTVSRLAARLPGWVTAAKAARHRPV